MSKGKSKIDEMLEFDEPLLEFDIDMFRVAFWDLSDFTEEEKKELGFIKVDDDEEIE